MKKRITALFVAAMLLTGLFAFAGTASAGLGPNLTCTGNLNDVWINDSFTVTFSGPETISWKAIGQVTITGSTAKTCTFKVNEGATAGSGVKAEDVLNAANFTACVIDSNAKSATATFKVVDYYSGTTLSKLFADRKVGRSVTFSTSEFNISGLTCVSVNPPSWTPTVNNDSKEFTVNVRGYSSSSWNNWYNAPLFPGDPNYNAYPGSGYWYNGVWIPGTNNPYSYQTTAPVQQAAPNAKSNVGVGGTLQLTSTMLGGVNPYTPGIAFRSSDTRVATITNNGLVTGVGAGVTRITASDGYGRQYGSWDLVVGNKTSSASSNAQVFTLSKTKYTMKRDSEFQLFATSKGQKIQVNWISSNPAIASVDENGWVTTYDRRGKVKITAFISGGSSKVCTLTVK